MNNNCDLQAGVPARHFTAEGGRQGGGLLCVARSAGVSACFAHFTEMRPPLMTGFAIADQKVERLDVG